MKPIIQIVFDYLVRYKYYLLLAVFLIPVFTSLFYRHQYHNYRDKYNYIISAPVKSDTVFSVKTHYDTIKIVKPRYTTRTEIRRDTVRIWQANGDDTLAVVPLVSKTYQDSLYKASVSGYIDVNLDSIQVYPKTIVQSSIITNQVYIKEKKKKFSLNVNFGYGLQYNYKEHKINNGPYIGIGLGYKLFNF